jgi:hypothetical protein
LKKKELMKEKNTREQKKEIKYIMLNRNVGKNSICDYINLFSKANPHWVPKNEPLQFFHYASLFTLFKPNRRKAGQRSRNMSGETLWMKIIH